MIAGIHPVGVHGAQILSVQLDEGAGELVAESKTLGEVVGLKFKLAAEDVEEQLDDSVHGGEGVAEEDEADDDGVLGVEAECVVERGVVEEDGEEGEDVEKVCLELC